MKRVVTLWLIRVIAAAAMAFVVAGEFAHRSAFGEWLPVSRFRKGLPVLYTGTALDGTPFAMVEIYSDAETGYFSTPAMRGGHLIAFEQRTRPSNELPQMVLESVVNKNLGEEEWDLCGWPVRFAAYASTGTRYSVQTDVYRPFRVTTGIWTLGPLHVATRPVLPGFIVLILSLLSSIVGLETAVRTPARIRRKRRRKRGLCVACGYDLTGVQGVCPECGAAHA